VIARLIYLFVALGAAVLLGLSMYYEYALGLHACAATVLTRYALVSATLLAAFALAVNGGRMLRIGMSACIGLVCVVGALFAAHQSWPRRVPLDPGVMGVSLDAAVRSLPLADVLPRFFMGSGSCAGTRWSVIGVNASQWALIAFAAFLVAAYLAARRR
jgi:protein dithiol:quinone oxidoreductase